MDKLVTAVIAIVAVPLVLIGYILLVEWVVGRFRQKTADWLRPVLWVFPAVALLFVFLVYPMIVTGWFSLWNFDAAGSNFASFAGIDNYIAFFTNNDTLMALRNNLIWVILLPTLAVGIVLIIEVLVDPVRYESVVKSVVFLPMAISFVAATVIWKLVYDYN